MRFLSKTLILACAFFSLSTASAQLGSFSLGASLGGEKKEESLISASMNSSVTSYEKGKAFYLSYRVTAIKPWHLYYRNPGTVGLIPKVQLELPQGFSAEGPYWEVPKREEGAIGVFYGYAAMDYVWKVTPSSDAADTVVFKGRSENQACNDEGCSPPLEAEAQLSLSAGPATANPQWKSIEKTVEVLGDTPVDITVSEKDSSTLIFQFNTEEALDYAYFFSDDNVIAPNQIQELSRSGNTNTLLLTRNDNTDTLYPAPETPALSEPVKALKGILVYGEKHMKVDVTVSDELSVTAQASAGGIPTDLWVVIGSLFMGGLILNLMPCVFPVIGLKIMSFVELSGGSRRKVLMHAGAFVVGVLVCFWVLSLILIILSRADALAQTSWSQWLSVIFSDAGSSSRTWAVWMQNPWIVYILVLLLLVLGLSMYGLFEFGVSATGAGQKLQQKDGVAGSFFSGLLATVVATPCSAPFLGGALPAAMSMPAIWMLVAMSFMAIGLSFPYIVIGAFPSLVRFLPRPGAWMESLKQGLSFLLFAAVAWFIVVYLEFLPEIYEDDDTFVLIGFVTVAAAFWVYGRWCPMYRPKNVRFIGGACALSLLISGVFLSMPREEPTAEQLAARPQWEDWSAGAMNAALAEGKPVFVDYTAKWCATCQSNKKVGYNDEVYATMKQYGVVLMRADKTRPNAAIDAELQKLKRTSIPVNVLYQQGKAPVITEVLLTPDYLVEFFNAQLGTEKAQ